MIFLLPLHDRIKLIDLRYCRFSSRSQCSKRYRWPRSWNFSPSYQVVYNRVHFSMLHRAECYQQTLYPNHQLAINLCCCSTLPSLLCFCCVWTNLPQRVSWSSPCKLQSAMFLDVQRMKIIATVPLLTFRYTGGTRILTITPSVISTAFLVNQRRQIRLMHWCHPLPTSKQPPTQNTTLHIHSPPYTFTLFISEKPNSQRLQHSVFNLLQSIPNQRPNIRILRYIISSIPL